jgi:hypothetical protein
MQGSASKRRFFVKKRAKNFIHLQPRSGGEGRASKPRRAKRRHEVFLLLFIHKKKTFLASSGTPTCSAISAKPFSPPLRLFVTLLAG